MQKVFRWLEEAGEVPLSPMAKMRAPSVPEQPVGIFTDDELSRLLAVCMGSTFDNRRDMALIRMLLDTGMRVAELIGRTIDDLDDEQAVAM